MIEKRDFFNFTKVNEQEFQEYLKKGFVNDESFKTQIIIYKIVFAFLIIYCSISLISFYKLRHSYIINQRGFNLSFWGGIAAFLDIILSFLPQITEVPCALSVYQANIVNVLVNLIFFCRSLRIVLYYHYNVFKVTSVKKNKLIYEPNNYLSKIMKRIKIILIHVIAIPTLISFTITIIIHLTMQLDECSFTEFEDAMLGLKANQGRKLFYVIQFFGISYTFISFIMSVLLSYVKDSTAFGVKFECLSTCIIIFIANVVNGILQSNASNNFEIEGNSHIKVILNLFELTKGGKLLFTVVSIYIIFTSITLPVIHYFKAKAANRRYIEEDLTSKIFFNKILNVPSLVNELRNIAIKEFSVENVLFWENYQILQNMNYRYYSQYKKAEELGDEKLVNQYDFEGYYQEQMNSFTKTSVDGYSLDSNSYVPKPIVPYYSRFYKTFIDSNGSAPVNILGQTINQIQSEISCPTIGIFDTAKDEVTDLMYSSIYPILLKNHEKYIIETMN